MTEPVPPPATDEPQGDVGDQAARLQMLQEQEAIRAALEGRVDGSDELDRAPEVDTLEGPDVLDGQAVDASDDPVYGGGMPVTDPEESAVAIPDDAVLDPELAMTGLADDGAAMAIDEGSSVDDDLPWTGFERDGDPGILDEDLLPVDDETAAEDLDALAEVQGLGHDPDDPLDPDGYGVPPAADGGVAAHRSDG